jgi:nitrite reductase (NO-forming)
LYKIGKSLIAIVTCAMVLSACNTPNTATDKQKQAKSGTKSSSQVFEPHKGVNQKPTPIKIKRIGEHEVNIQNEMKLKRTWKSQVLFYF